MNRYTEKDIIPITYLLLQALADAYLCNAYKFLVHLRYPDLAGIISTDLLDHAALNTLMTTNDEPIKAAIGNLERILEASMSLSNIYNLQRENVIGDTKINRYASNIYCHVVMDNFPSDDQMNTTSYQEYLNHLNLFALSTIAVTGTLCILIAQRRLNLSNVWDSNFSFLQNLSIDYRNHEYFTALEIVQKLGLELFNNFDTSYKFL